MEAVRELDRTVDWTSEQHESAEGEGCHHKLNFGSDDTGILKLSLHRLDLSIAAPGGFGLERNGELDIAGDRPLKRLVEGNTREELDGESYVRSDRNYKANEVSQSVSYAWP
jgi:hypothetical protein